MGKLLLGADEVAWGSLAGPLIVCAASAVDGRGTMCVRDSKKYGKNANRMWSDIRKSTPMSLGYCTHVVSPLSMAKRGNRVSREYAFQQCVAKLRVKLCRYGRVIIDGDDDFGVPFSEAVIKADDIYKVVSLASCIAKAQQVSYMLKVHKQYPMYGFDTHHGYGTDKHVQAIREYGVINGIHRMPIIIKMFRRKDWELKTHT